MKLDIVFRGCTRPQLVLGVPMIPIMLAFGFVVLLCMWFSGKFIVMLPILFIIMRTMVKIDEHIFDLLALRLRVSAKTVPNSKSKNGDLIIGPHNFQTLK
jgi:type IV secretion system protein VirB3